MRILIVTDAWRPQVNGVVRTLEVLAARLAAMGVAVEMVTPDEFLTVPLPFYREIRIAPATAGQLARRIGRARPDAIHIATEGPLGMAARRACLALGLPFTTSYHTRFPEFLRARLPVPEAWSYAWLRRFHNRGQAMLVAAPSLAAELTARGFTRARPWSRGVDTGLFHPGRRAASPLRALPGPVFAYVGRVAVEKDLPAFLDLDLPGSKVVTGDGPGLARLRDRYRDVVFTGTLEGKALAEIYAGADVFVFPSRTDTFGNVILEALASGTPVAAFPVTGPLDIIGDGKDGKGGVLSGDLRQAALAALGVPRAAARRRALDYDWDECARQFLDRLSVAGQDADRRGHAAPAPRAVSCPAGGGKAGAMKTQSRPARLAR